MELFWKRLARALGDDDFGPHSPVLDDLTLEFEDNIFTIGPSVLLMLLAPFYIRHYIGLPVITKQEPLVFLKLGVSGIIIALHIVSAVLYNPPDGSSSNSIAASVLACLATLALALFMYFEHRHALESSPLPAVYLFVTTLLDAAKARSYFIRSAFGLYPVACVTVAVGATKLVLLVLGELPKRYQSRKDTLGPESSSGFWGRTFLIWVNSTLLLGFRNVLSVDDLPNLDASFASARLAAIFESFWKQRDSSKFALIKATFRAQAWPFLRVIPARLLHMGFTFAEPLLLQQILKQVSREDRDPEVIQGLIGAMALVHFGLTITRMWYKHMNNRVMAKVRGTLISQVLRKSFSLGPHEAKRSAASTLMSTDVDGIINVIPQLHETWASIIELALSVYLLSTVVAESAFLTMLPATFAAVVSVEIGKRIAPAIRSWNENIEKRVSITSQILSQLRGIKMIAAETAIGKYIQSLRRTELKYSKKVRKLSTWRTLALTTSFISPPIIVIAAALFWRGFDGGLTAVNAFTALAFIYLSSRPMASILRSWSQIGGIIACFGRIQAYMLLAERVDSREMFPGADEKKPTHNLELFPVQFLSATISAPDGRDLCTIDVIFEQGTTTMIVGPTGVGKSMLLKTVLGEVSVSSGSVYVLSQQIAYCGQEEWILNVTMREYIIGTLPYDKQWFMTVAKACLLSDLSEFPQGYLTLTGSRGSNLSGGQRQRLELARAVYTRAKVVILDGVLSAVDRRAAASILTSLIGEGGLLRNLGSTVIMSTHSVELLKSADRVLVLGTNGTVSIQSPEAAIKEYEGKGFLDDFSDDGEDISDSSSQNGAPARHYTPPEPKKQPEMRLRQKGDVELYKYYFKSVNFTMLVSWLVVLALLTLTEKGPDIYMRLWVEKAPQNKTLFAGYAVLGLSTLLVNVLWSWLYFMYLVPESAENLHQTLITSVVNATLSFLTYTDSGALLNRFSQDMSLVVQDLPLDFLYFTYFLSGVLVNIAVISAAVKYAAVVIPIIVGILYYIQLYYLRTSRQLRLLDLEAKSPIYSHLKESSEGIIHIRAFQWEQEYIQKGLDLLDKSQKPFYYRYCIQRWLGLVCDLIISATGVILVSLALYIGSTTQAAVGLGLLKVMQVTPDLIVGIEKWVDLETSLGAISRTREFERDTPQEESGGEDPPNLPANWPNRGQILVEDLNADHVINGEDLRALHEITLEIDPGSKVGIVGRSGSGKTTFLLTLLNFLKFTGSIVIDGVDITAIPPRLLRSRITTISQEFMDLPGSVRDNLVPQEMMLDQEDRHHDALLVSVLATVGLGQVIRRAGGLDIAVEDVGLSAGQQQLFALARALLHHRRTNSKLIFVDEATSYIDYDSEEKLHEVMDEAFEDCTVLTIAHRNHSLQSATNFLELSSGRLSSYE